MSLDEFSRQDVEFHRATAAVYDADVTRTYSVYHHLMLEPFLDSLHGGLAPAQALDVGCGTGVVALALAQRGIDGLGIDHSPEMLAIAEAKFAASKVPGSWRFLTGDVRALPAKDGEFDVVTCQGLLHHLEQLRPALVEMMRVLRPGGAFYISEPARNPTPLKRVLEVVWRLLPHRSRGAIAADAADSVEQPIDAEALRAELAQLRVDFDMRFLTHVPPLRRALPDQLYAYLIRGLSFPWRRRRGDLVFVFGRKPGEEPTG